MLLCYLQRSQNPSVPLGSVAVRRSSLRGGPGALPFREVYTSAPSYPQYQGFGGEGTNMATSLSSMVSASLEHSPRCFLLLLLYLYLSYIDRLASLAARSRPKCAFICNSLVAISPILFHSIPIRALYYRYLSPMFYFACVCLAIHTCQTRFHANARSMRHSQVR